MRAILRQSQARQTSKMTQMRTFQVESISFQVSEHLFNPHTAAIRPQRILLGSQVGGQEPRQFLALFPVCQQVDWAGMLGRQESRAQPNTLPRILDQIPKALPCTASGEFDLMVSLLPQRVVPAPLSQLADDGYSAEFTVSSQKNGHITGINLRT